MFVEHNGVEPMTSCMPCTEENTTQIGENPLCMKMAKSKLCNNYSTFATKQKERPSLTAPKGTSKRPFRLRKDRKFSETREKFPNNHHRIKTMLYETLTPNIGCLVYE